MNDFMTLRSYELPDLQKLVRQIWPQSKMWRLFQDQIQFGLPTTYGNEWFPLYQAPEKVEIFVKSWYRSGGLRAEERIDL